MSTTTILAFRFFKKLGFEEIERDGSRVLLHLDLGANTPPKLIFTKSEPFKDKKDASIIAFYNCQCPWSKLMIDDLNKNTKENPNIKLNIIETKNRRIIEKFGISRGLLIEGKPVIKRIALWNEMGKEIEKIKN